MRVSQTHLLRRVLTGQEAQDGEEEGLGPDAHGGDAEFPWVPPEQGWYPRGISESTVWCVCSVLCTDAHVSICKGREEISCQLS